MTGLKPAKVLHGKYFDISMSTVHNVLAIVALMFATFVVIKFFIGYLLYGVIAAMAVAMVIEFFSDWHRNSSDWSAD